MPSSCFSTFSSYLTSHHSPFSLIPAHLWLLFICIFLSPFACLHCQTFPSLLPSSRSTWHLYFPPPSLLNYILLPIFSSQHNTVRTGTCCQSNSAGSQPRHNSVSTRLPPLPWVLLQYVLLFCLPSFAYILHLSNPTLICHARCLPEWALLKAQENESGAAEKNLVGNLKVAGA